MKIKAAIFDMDGTLVDSLMLWDVFWKEMGIRYGKGSAFRPSDEDEKAVRTLTLKGAMDLIHTKYAMGESGDELFEFINQITIDFYSNKIELKEGVKEFLEYCKEKGVKMCIASATDSKLIKVAMKRCKLDTYFLKIFSCVEVGAGKEKPDVFLRAQEYLGEAIEETWVFEDSLLAIETATKIGMHTVGIYDRYNLEQDEIRRIATEYVAEGENMQKLIKMM